MKKIYMIPTTKVVKIQTAKMIAQSIPMNAQDAQGPGMSRRGDIDFDDFDEEY